MLLVIKPPRQTWSPNTNTDGEIPQTMMTINCILIQGNSSVILELPRGSELVGGSNFPCFLTPANQRHLSTHQKKEKERQSQISFTSHPLHCPYQVSECSSIPPCVQRQYPPVASQNEMRFCAAWWSRTWILVGLKSRKKKRWEKIDGVVRKLT